MTKEEIKRIGNVIGGKRITAITWINIGDDHQYRLESLTLENEIVMELGGCSLNVHKVEEVKCDLVKGE